VEDWGVTVGVLVTVGEIGDKCLFGHQVWTSSVIESSSYSMRQ